MSILNPAGQGSVVVQATHAVDALESAILNGKQSKTVRTLAQDALQALDRARDRGINAAYASEAYRYASLQFNNPSLQLPERPNCTGACDPDYYFLRLQPQLLRR